MRRYIHSVGYALSGWRAAIHVEHNLKVFVFTYGLSLLLGVWAGLSAVEWVVVLFSGAVFLSIELLNTAIERFTDAFDAHAKAQDDVQFLAIKNTKDISAGAALMTGLAWAAVLLIIFLPYAWAALSELISVKMA